MKIFTLLFAIALSSQILSVRQLQANTAAKTKSSTTNSNKTKNAVINELNMTNFDTIMSQLGMTLNQTLQVAFNNASMLNATKFSNGSLTMNQTGNVSYCPNITVCLGNIWNSTKNGTSQAWNSTVKWFDKWFVAPSQKNQTVQGFPFASSNDTLALKTMISTWNAITNGVKKLFGYKILENGASLKNATKDEIEAFEYLNTIRMKPQSAINDLNTLKRLAIPPQNTNYNISGSLITTQEGNVAIDDAIKFLTSLKANKANALGPYYWSDALYNSTKRQVVELNKTKNFMLFTARHSEVQKRIQTAMNSTLLAGENQIYGPDWYGQGKFAILRMVIDDGVQGRQNRQNLFSNYFNQTAISVGANMTVVDFGAQK